MGITRIIVIALAAALPARSAFADVITDWDEKAIAFVTPHTTPPEAQRQVASVHAAMFDAVNSIERRYQPYVVQLPASRTTSQEAAAASAAATTLAALSPRLEKEVKAALDTYLQAIPDGEAKAAGIGLGRAVAAKVLEARANDGATAPDSYRPRAEPGKYVPTAITVASMFPKVKPFVMSDAAQFRPPPPPALDSDSWVAAYNEIKELGAKNSPKRSDRQTEDARFWLMTGPQAYHPVARQLVAAKNMSVVDSARFMTLLSLAEADAFIAVFDAKYAYELWRPITAIRNGDLLANPKLVRDAAWLPIDATPMHPEYPCAHCICGGALAAVAETALGTAQVPELKLTSPTAPGVTRRYTDLWALANEVSDARIYAGFHYRFSTEVGRDMGRSIGEYVARNILKPVTVAEAR